MLNKCLGHADEEIKADERSEITTEHDRVRCENEERLQRVHEQAAEELA
jgi:hypothetical protein